MLPAGKIKLICAVSFFLGAACALLTTTLTVFFVVHHRSASLHGALTRFSHSAPASGRPRPCGSLDSIEIPLATPEEVFPDRQARLQPPKWFFENFNEIRLARFLSSCDLRPVEKRVLLDAHCWDVGPTGIVVSPPEQLIWSLSHTSRKQIYSVLAKCPENFSQRFPFRFSPEGFDLKLRDSGLPVEQVERIKRLTYTNADYVCFADLEAIRARFKDDEFKELIGTLYQLPTYLLRLRVAPDSDTEALAKYWGKGGREKRIAPLLEALAKVPGGTEVNVSYLLPTLARLRLYTYPYAWNQPAVAKEDCFFTALNFFNETPSTKYLDATNIAITLKTEYGPAPDAPTFGDLIILQNNQGQAFHASVYIADDFVFTKNGVNPNQPWVLMKLSDMLMLYYPEENAGKICFLRRKDMAG